MSVSLRLDGSTFRTALVAIAACIFAGDASAQSAACENYRGQLAALERSASGGDAGRYAAAARRQEAELARSIAYGRQLGCDRQQFLFFGSPPPAECGSVNRRIVQQRANLRELEAQAGGGQDLQRRRAQLLAAIDQTCRTSPQQAAPRNLFEALFGVPRDAMRPPSSLPELDPEIDAEAEFNRRLGGNRAVCVRTCDGFFFPLPTSTGGRRGAEELCQALCPGTESALYFMNPAGNIQDAVSADGKPYSQLPNAARYQTALDPNCGCKAQGQTWAQVLSDAEAMLTRRRGDIIVTEAKAEELSRVQPVRPANETARQRAARERAERAERDKQAALVREAQARGKTATDATPAADDSAAAEQAASGAAAPTASQDSAGIGPRNLEAAGPVDRRAGQTQDVVLPDGQRRKVRVIGNGLTPIPRQ